MKPENLDAVPYLHEPPAVIPIDLGRQLFVDDFLIESHDLKRTHHRPKYRTINPVLRPAATDPEGLAGVFSDGVWYDPVRRKFLLWYWGTNRATCLAVSDDGLRWERPQLDNAEKNNVTLKTVRDSATVWLDHTAPPEQRFRLFEARYRQKRWEMALRTSATGESWSEETVVSGPSWDRSTAFYNPFRRVWVASVRGHDHAPDQAVHRVRCYHEGRTPEAALNWYRSSDDVAKGDVLEHDLTPWTRADRLDPHHPDERFKNIAPQLYNLDAFPYESLMVGLFVIWQGPDNPTCKALGIHKRNEVLVGYSRDGFHWDRPDRTPFLPVADNPKAWNAGNVQSAGGGCLVMGDELWFYCSGRTMHPRSETSTGLAVLRRDGFVSLDAGADGGTLTTRPVKFTGKHLFVNAAVQGELRIEVLDQDGNTLPGLSFADCLPLSGDLPRARVAWKNRQDLSALAGRPVRFRFRLTSGSLWSFWVTTDPAGASAGYVAAGGPGFSGPTDTAPTAK